MLNLNNDEYQQLVGRMKMADFDSRMEAALKEEMDRVRYRGAPEVVISIMQVWFRIGYMICETHHKNKTIESLKATREELKRELEGEAK